MRFDDHINHDDSLEHWCMIVSLIFSAVNYLRLFRTYAGRIRKRIFAVSLLQHLSQLPCIFLACRLWLFCI